MSKAPLMRIAPLALLLVGLSSCSMLTGHKPEPTYVIFFTERSATLDPAALKVVADAAAKAKLKGAGTTVTVLGYTDRQGNKTADQVLSSERAESVAQALMTDGVSMESIRREGRGQSRGDPGVEARRVEIAVGD